MLANKVDINLGINEGVLVKLLRNNLAIDYFDLNVCVAHSFALVGSQASYISQKGNICFVY